MASRRQCAVLAAKRIRSQLGSDDETPGHHENVTAKPSATASLAKNVSKRKTDASSSSHDASFASAHPSKRPKPSRRPTIKLKGIPNLQERLFDASYASYETETDAHGCQFPLRQHSLLYHRPLLLQGPTGKQGRAALLKWFDSVSTRRRMPWRKDWINPKDHNDAAELRRALSVRAYEVWISEIMLQQTRVSVVIDYWTRWMTRWPTIEQLAAAEEDEVTSAWRGLGYYSRSKRIHEAAKMVVHDPSWRGLLPQDAGELQAKIPGLLGNVKSDKAVIDLLWAAADALVEAVVLETPGVDEVGNLRPSDRSGRWGQALMELGSTICTPNPDCTACPITSTCRAHQEGKVLAAMQGYCREPPSNASGPVEIEDVCGICEPFEDITDDVSAGHEVATSKAPARGRKQATESPFFTSRTSSGPGEKEQNWPESDSPQVVKAIASHARRFPLKVARKAVREQETIVCAVRRNSDGYYLIQKRPEKGLLAGLWEFPSHILPDASDSDTSGARRKHIAREFVTGFFGSTARSADARSSKTVTAWMSNIKHMGELGSIPWVFSHLKLTMHVHVFQLEDEAKPMTLAQAQDAGPCRWADAESVEQESMGTGSRCSHGDSG